MTLPRGGNSRQYGEISWLVPFLCIALIALGLLRPLPHFPLPAHYRTVVDGGGVQVHIALPFRGIALATNAFPQGYLEYTRSPALLVYGGKPSDRRALATNVMGWIYPDVVNNDRLWNNTLFKNTSSPYSEIETLLAYDPSVWIGCGGPPDLVRRVGLPTFGCGGSAAQRKRSGLPDLRAGAGCGTPPDSMRSHYSQAYLNGSYYSEGYIFPGLRLASALIGHPEAAEPRIDAYCQIITDLRNELRPETLDSRPSVLMEGEDKGNGPRAGIIDAEAQRKVSGDDAEHLLILDPDMIFLASGSPLEFMRNPLWQGLKAVRNRRVYRRPGLMEFWAIYLTIKPISTRWMAEVAHPDRLQPEVRQLLRDRVLSELGYRLSEDQIDQILHVEDNSGSVGTERFLRGYQITRENGSSK